MAIKTSTMTITPKLAANWLNTINTHNRPIRNRDVEKYADEMTADRWILNGEAIIFDEKGTLADGQHRLYACIEADKPFKTVVVEGVSTEAFPTIDAGTKRSASDILHIAGIRGNLNALAAASNIVLGYNAGTLMGKRPFSRQETLMFVRENPELQDWVALAKSKGWTSQHASSIAAIAYLGSFKHPTKAKEFVRKFTTGEELVSGSPVLSLRNRLGTDKGLSRPLRLGLIALAWNAFATNRQLLKMQAPRGDTFPKIVGAKK